MQIDEKKKRKKRGKKKGKRGLRTNVHARRERGQRPHRPGEKGYPDEKTWEKLKKESLLREVVRSIFDELADIDTSMQHYNQDESPEWLNPEHLRWLQSLAAEHEEEHAKEKLPPNEDPDNVGETSGGQDRPLSRIR